MKKASMQDLFKKLGKLSPDELILDVRSPGEFASGHVPGSRNVPHPEVDRHAAELKKYKTIYIHCHAGTRAMVAHGMLSLHGLDNLICVSGGMADWVAAGYPVER